MRNKFIKLFVITVAVLLLWGCSSIDQDALAGGDMMFWKVSDEDSSVYLLGSIHFGKEEFYPMPSLVEAAFLQSDALGVEIDMLNIDQLAMQTKMMQNMFYQDGTTLTDHLNAETEKILNTYLTSRGLDISMFANMKAGAVILTISSLEAQGAGLEAQYGIDMHYLSKANDLGKKIVEFESLDSQIDMMFGDEELAEGMLYKTLKEASNFSSMIDSLAKTWKSGDAKAMNKLMTSWESPQEKKYLENLFGERDVNMTAKIEKMLAENTNAFVILGAGHFVNDTGIINRLADKKYQIIKY